METKIKEKMRTLLQKEWNGKPVWKAISDGELTSAPAFKGELYDNCSVRIMYVGHAVNGWEEDSILGHESLEDTLNAIMSEQGAFDTFVNEEGYPYITASGNRRIYRHINYNFFRLIKGILENLGESDAPTTEESWYNDSKCWQQKFVWSNLYNIAPRCGGNPEDRFIKPNMAEYIEIFKNQVLMYVPDIVICCPMKGYFVPWKNEPAFKDILDSYEECSISNTIVAKGNLRNSKVIVCKRPDSRGMSREDVGDMAKCIFNYTNQVCR